jgi:pantothenate kinase
VTVLGPDVLAGARRLIVPGERHLLGITGAPGAGKSTLAAALVEALAPEAVLVPMDGFHLAAAELHRLGRHERKGAPDTFDAAGYAALLDRLRDQVDDVVYAPAFRREIEEPIAGAIAVSRNVPLVITEGNYLLYWHSIRPLLDEVWFVETDEATRLDRLIERHMAYGRTLGQAEQRSYGSDQRNAELIAATRAEADRVVNC